MSRVSGFKMVSAAAYNRKAAGYFLEIAKLTEDGQFYTAKASLLFSAFTHEAFLNSLGEKLLPSWGQLDRIPVGKKLKIISSHIAYVPNLGVELTRFRGHLILWEGGATDVKETNPVFCRISAAND